MSAPGLGTPDQIAGARYATRGMSRDAVPQAQQIVAGRTEQQTTRRRPKICRGCEGERDTLGVFCTACQDRRERGA